MAFASDKGRQGAAGVSTGGYSIDNSLRFNDTDRTSTGTGSNSYLSFVPTTTSNRRTATFSAWVKRSILGNIDNIISFGRNQQHVRFQDQINIRDYNDGSSQLDTSALFRDVSAWYHIVLAIDTTQATASNRIKLYVNGSQVTSFGTEVYPTLNQDWSFNYTGATMYIGAREWNNATPGSIIQGLDGYMSEVHWIDGTALDPTSFGETGDYGEWKPIEVTGMTYGTNGFYLDFGNTGDKHTITVQGDVQHTTSPKKIGDSSIHFLHNGGTADILKLSSYPSDLVFSGDFTYEFWAYKDDTSSSGAVFGNNESGYGVPCQWRMMSTGNMSIHMNGSSTWSMASGFGTSTSYTASVWQHWALVRSGSTITLYRDGVSQATTTSSQAQTLQGSSTFVIGGSQGSDYYNGHLDEIRISNTARYTSGFTPSTTAFTDDANTMLLIHSDTTVFESTTFTDDSGVVGGLGTDASSNTNNWTVNNLAATDQMLDSPTNNFATLNPLREGYSSPVLSEGNLKFQVSGANSYANAPSTIGMTSGKWYWESYLIDGATGSGKNIGIHGNSVSTGQSDLPNSSFHPSIAWQHYGSVSKLYQNSTAQQTGLSQPANGDIIGFALDMESGTKTLQFYLNNVTTGSAVTYLGDIAFAAATYNNSANGHIANFGQDSSFAGNKTAQGNQDSNSIGDFYYEPPTDFLALCTSNLPDPAVVPSEHFNTVTYTGTENASVHGAVTGVGFQPDMIWFKNRNFSYNNAIYDALRGTNSYLVTNSTGTEVNPPAGKDLTSFDSDGFSLGTSWGAITCGKEGSTFRTYVAWNWKANGAGVSNTNGTIASTVSANADAGFSIVSYTGTGANATVGHGLAKKPNIFMLKGRNDTPRNWRVYSDTIGATKHLYLNTTASEQVSSTQFNNTEPTSSVFTIGSHGGVNTSTKDYIAYCFHSVDGYSKVGSYTGNMSADGPFVYTGFRPKYIMVKDSSTATGWYIYDTVRDINIHNPAYKTLVPNTSGAESGSATSHWDILSNGFKPRYANNEWNANGSTMIYIAFAEVPFKFSNAR